MNKYKWIKLKFLTFPIKQSSSWGQKAIEKKCCWKIIMRQRIEISSEMVEIWAASTKKCRPNTIKANVLLRGKVSDRKDGFC